MQGVPDQGRNQERCDRHTPLEGPPAGIHEQSDSEEGRTPKEERRRPPGSGAVASNPGRAGARQEREEDSGEESEEHGSKLRSLHGDGQERTAAGGRTVL